MTEGGLHSGGKTNSLKNQAGVGRQVRAEGTGGKKMGATLERRGKMGGWPPGVVDV